MFTKTRLYAIMEKAEAGDRLSRKFDICIVSLIALNVVMVILETVDGFKETYGRFFDVFEFV